MKRCLASQMVKLLKKKFYFKKGKINVIGTDHDGWAEAEIYLYHERNWEEAVSKSRSGKQLI
jgi:hypothetical protein